MSQTPRLSKVENGEDKKDNIGSLHVVSFTNILWAYFPPISFFQQSMRPSCNYKKAVRKKFVKLTPVANFTNNILAHLRQYSGAKKIQA